jgi:hypothetical protein
MKNVALAMIALLLVSCSATKPCLNPETTKDYDPLVVFLVRHAEKKMSRPGDRAYPVPRSYLNLNPRSCKHLRLG